MATACLGVGFGLTVPTLNTFTAAFHPDAGRRSVLVLNALLGLGTALAPVFVAIFVGLGFWWGLPVLSAVLLAGLLVASVRCRCRPRPRRTRRTDRRTGTDPAPFLAVRRVRRRSTASARRMNGNWSPLDMTTELGASTTRRRHCPHHVLGDGHRRPGAVRRDPAPLPEPAPTACCRSCSAVAFVAIAALPDEQPGAGIARLRARRARLLGAAPAHDQLRPGDLVAMSAATAGGVIAAYQLGYGIAAFGAGPLQDAGV